MRRRLGLAFFMSSMTLLQFGQVRAVCYITRTCYEVCVTSGGTTVCGDECYDEVDSCTTVVRPPGSSGGSGGGGTGGGGPASDPNANPKDLNNDGKMDCWRGSVTTSDTQADILVTNDKLGINFGGENDIRPDHNGIDIECNDGDPIYAAANGTVAQTGDVATNPSNPAGNFIWVSHTDGRQSRYAHLRSVGVLNAQTVTVGQQIGTCDSTGNATGDHLHLGIRDQPGGTPLDPAAYLGRCPQ